MGEAARNCRIRASTAASSSAAGQAEFVDVARTDQMAQKDQHLHGEHPDLDLGQAEAGMVGRNGQIAQPQQPHAAGDTGAIDPGDQRNGGGPDDSGDPAEIRTRLVGGGLECVGSAAEIGARAKGLVAGARQHDGPQAGVLMRLPHGCRNPLQHVGGD
jgi:hypothetical protein